MEGFEIKMRVLMFPWLAHGHITAFYELAKRLSRRHFKIYICSSPVNLTSFRSLSESHDGFPSIEFIDLEIPSDELPPELHTTKNLPSHLIPTLIKIFQDSDSSYSEILTTRKPDLVIFDVYQPWAAKIASSKGIPSVFFSTAGATAISYSHHSHTYRNTDDYPFPAIYYPFSTPKLPDMPPVKDAGEGPMLGCLELSSEIVLIHAYREVEAKYLEYLSVLSNKSFVATGPLIGEFGTNVFRDEIKQSEIMEWLSGKPQFSTLYISFGSESFLSHEQVHELAEGIELSGANFLWVIRFPSMEKKPSLEAALPEGFLERSKDKGMIVTDWAPQTRILGHQSICAFVSHCGWSSTTESLYFGVPVIAMPMNYEQPINAKMLVEAGVAVEVEREDGIYRGKAIANVINEVILDKKIIQNLKNRVAEISKEIRKNEGEINGVADELLKICNKNKESN